MRERSKERIHFLYNIMISAIEHGGYGFSRTIESKFDDDDEANAYAVIYNGYDDPNLEKYADQWGLPDDWKPAETFRITIDTMTKGLGIVRDLPKRADGVADWVKDLIKSDRTNGEDGDYDVIGALLVLECALFGQPTYS